MCRCRRAAWNLCFQDKMPVTGELTALAQFKGQDLIGTPLKAPYCLHERIYVLPLLTILMTKGTGVVTSVPSDSPTDYMALQVCFLLPRDCQRMVLAIMASQSTGSEPAGSLPWPCFCLSAHT